MKHKIYKKLGCIVYISISPSFRLSQKSLDYLLNANTKNGRRTRSESKFILNDYFSLSRTKKKDTRTRTSRLYVLLELQCIRRRNYSIFKPESISKFAKHRIRKCSTKRYDSKNKNSIAFNANDTTKDKKKIFVIHTPIRINIIEHSFTHHRNFGN